MTGRWFAGAQRDVGRRWGLPLVVLVLSLCATVIGWYAVRLVVERQATGKFDARVLEVQDMIHNRLDLYLGALYGAKGLYASSHDGVEPDELAAYFNAIDLHASYPGLLAVKFIEYRRDQQQPVPDPDTLLPDAAIGGHTARRAMLERARDTGRMSMTGRVRLRARGEPDGFLLALPIYHNQLPQDGIEQRQMALSGFVVGIFDAGKFFSDTFQQTDLVREGLDLEVFDQEVISFIEHGTTQAMDGHELYDANPQRLETVAEHRKSRFHALAAFPVADRAWSLHFIGTPGFGLDPIQRYLPLLILAAGAAVSLLLFGLTYVLATSRVRATRLAERMTSELRKKQELLLGHEQALATELEEHKRLKDEISRKAGQLGQTNAELLRRERVTQSLLEDLQTSKHRLEQQQHSLEEAHANLQRSHDEMLDVQLQLIQSEKLESIGRLAAGVAHEVKNPLAVILMGVTYLQRQMANGDPNVPMVLNEMDLAVRRADTVVRGLLDFSAPSEIHLRDEDLNAVIDQALILVKHELQKSHVAVVKETSELPPVHLDGNKIQQVLINLFINAAHAMPSGGTLTIRTGVKPRAEIHERFGAKDTARFARHESLVVVEVDDTGTGIPEEKLHKVFDPFFTTKPTGKGTGLGLTVTKKIVELHGGLIDVRNRPGGGVRATLVVVPKTAGVQDGQEAHLTDR